MGEKGTLNMYDYEYVTKKEVKELKKILMSLINEVQDYLRRDYFTFRFDFNVGSGSRNLVTRLKGGNEGFDLDCDIRVNYDDDQYSASDVKHILMNAFNKFNRKYGFDFCEDNTRVFTIKLKNRANSKILYGCDFAIVNDYTDEEGYLCQEYIHHTKGIANSYQWEEQPDQYYTLLEYLDYCDENNLKEEIRDEYLRLKDYYGPNRSSMEVYYETINNVYQENAKKR
ncbi:MAG: hypothetical protein LUD22_00045 [Coprobacillus sp.]|nr:hypothetical protein [Coprobacillus sp.]